MNGGWKQDFYLGETFTTRDLDLVFKLLKTFGTMNLVLDLEETHDNFSGIILLQGLVSLQGFLVRSLVFERSVAVMAGRGFSAPSCRGIRGLSRVFFGIRLVVMIPDELYLVPKVSKILLRVLFLTTHVLLIDGDLKQLVF